MIILAALAAAALAGVVAVATAAGSGMLAFAAGLVVSVFCLGALRAAPVPAVRASAWVGLLGGITALAWIWEDGTPTVAPVAAVLGPALVLLMLVQLTRRERSSAVASLSVGMTGIVVALLPAFWLATRNAPAGFHVVELGLLGVVVAALCEAVPVAASVRRIVGVLVAALAAAVLVLQVMAVAEAVPAVAAMVICVFGAVMAALAFAIVDRVTVEGGVGMLPLQEPVEVPEPAQLGVDSPLVHPGGDLASGVAHVGPDVHPFDLGLPAEDPGVPVLANLDESERGTAVTALLALRVTLPLAMAAPVVFVLSRVLVG